MERREYGRYALDGGNKLLGDGAGLTGFAVPQEEPGLLGAVVGVSQLASPSAAHSSSFLGAFVGGFKAEEEDPFDPSSAPFVPYQDKTLSTRVDSCRDPEQIEL